MPINVLHIDTEKGFRGGEQQVLSLMRGLAARGVAQSLLVRRDSDLGMRVANEGMKVHVLRVHAPWDPRTWRQARQFAQTEGSTIVHAHTGNAHKLALSAFAGEIPIVVTRRVDFAIKRNWFSQRKYTHPCQHYIAISTGVRDVLVDGGVDPSRIDIVPSGIEPTRFANATTGADWRKQWNVTEPGPVIGVVAAYADHKDPLNLINAAPRVLKKLPCAKIVFVGEGDMRPEMETHIAKLDLAERVQLTGWQTDVGGCLAALDIFVMPSKLEGLCTSLLDAQAAGVPCVACRAGGIPDIIEDGVNGLLVPPQNPEALADAIVRLGEDLSLREKFRVAGCEVVARRFTVDSMVEGTFAVYKKILG